MNNQSVLIEFIRIINKMNGAFLHVVVAFVVYKTFHLFTAVIHKVPA